MKIYIFILASISLLFISCNSKDEASVNQTNLFAGEYGTCCADLKDACDTSKVQNSFFYISEEKVFYQTVGYMNTEKGPAYFDQAVIYCPFCGKKYRTKKRSRRRRIKMPVHNIKEGNANFTGASIKKD
ncbi:MAG: hypothetical protein IAF38_16100 [Bacteroidia bacterium]|nr:hypothetical protein [Bacteroidia bacterium]